MSSLLLRPLLAQSLIPLAMPVASLAQVPNPAALPAPDLSAAAPPDAWPAFRGVGNGHTAATGLPRDWAVDRHVAWSAAPAGYGQSSPVVWNDHVFVTSVDGTHKELCFVHCFRLGDGRLLWSRSFPASVAIEATGMVSRGAPTPAVDAERVYAFFESGDVFALDHGGERLWHRSLTAEFGAFEGNHGIGSSVLPVPGGVALLLDHAGPSYLVCLDRGDGSVRWKADREPRVSWSTPAWWPSSGGGHIVVSSNGVLDGYRVADGERLWRVDEVAGNTVPSPTIVGERVVVGASSSAGNRVVQRPATGVAAPRTLWASTSIRPSGFASPVVVDGVVYFVSKVGAVTAADLDSGEELWRERLPQACWASPIVAEGLIWFFGKEGQTSIVRPSREGLDIVATCELVEPDAAKTTIYGAAAVQGALLIRSGRRLWCLRAGDA